MISRFLVALFVLSGVGCSSADSTVVDFCKKHTRQEFIKAHGLLTAADKQEIASMAYDQFEWDQKTFDIHILRSHDQCHAEVLKGGEASALVTMRIKSLIHPRTFECVWPVVKESDGWRISRHFEPMESYKKTIVDERKKLSAELTAAVDLEEAAYKAKAAAAGKAYWAALDDAKKKVLDAAGGTVPVFCHGPLNLDGGRDLVYTYMEQQEQAEVVKKPKHVAAKEKDYGAIVDALRPGYEPLSTVVANGVRIDLVHSAVVTDKEGSRVNNYFALWGEIERPLSWRLYVYSKGSETHSGSDGAEPDVIVDLHEVVWDSPEMTLVMIEFERMPAATDELLVTLWDKSEQEYTASIPVKPDFLNPGG